MKWMFRLLLLAAFAWGAGFLYFHQLIASYPEDSGEPCDALVVLTGSAGRVEAGFELLEQGRAETLFITGVGDDAHSEKFLARYEPSPALKKKVGKPGVLSLDREATSTFENAEQTERWLEKNKYDRLCLVTAHYHMPRSLTLFRHAMPEKKWIPIAIASWDVKPGEVWENQAQFIVQHREYRKWLIVSLMTAIL